LRRLILPCTTSTRRRGRKSWIFALIRKIFDPEAAGSIGWLGALARAQWSAWLRGVASVGKWHGFFAINL
jgi:hypothetical protein